ncbi:DUF1194 domain-containing protein [Roseovarius sp. SCSIO 43702]|uniref:DUF1194 domain-containing protein n=1 Tax=Roseovarius sp. SCSIO 43702 TaxID=2823043 RepID=UPI002175A153|nr:DUF1194 domain-containing protein [Roseovarius sp. SCSIO 43702]
MVRLAACLALILVAGSAWSQAAPCRLALALGLDVSSSVDAREYDLQRLGLAAALDAPEVRHAILSGSPGDVALAVYEWSGFNQQKLHLDWTLLRSNADINRAIAALAAMERSHDDFPTAIGQGLGFGANTLARAPDCARKVLDISGDGINNAGFGPAAAYRHFPFEDVTVNGLVISRDIEKTISYYRDNVLYGPGAFMIVTADFEGFAEAMARKLHREINDLVFGAAPRDRARQAPG